MDNMIAAYLVKANMDADRSHRRRDIEPVGIRRSVTPLFSALAGVGAFAFLLDQLAR
jgi:hypothetical protein